MRTLLFIIGALISVVAADAHAQSPRPAPIKTFLGLAIGPDVTEKQREHLSTLLSVPYSQSGPSFAKIADPSAKDGYRVVVGYSVQELAQILMTPEMTVAARAISMPTHLPTLGEFAETAPENPVLQAILRDRRIQSAQGLKARYSHYFEFHTLLAYADQGKEPPEKSLIFLLPDTHQQLSSGAIAQMSTLISWVDAGKVGVILAPTVHSSLLPMPGAAIEPVERLIRRAEGVFLSTPFFESGQKRPITLSVMPEIDPVRDRDVAKDIYDAYDRQHAYRHVRSFTIAFTTDSGRTAEVKCSRRLYIDTTVEDRCPGFSLNPRQIRGPVLKAALETRP